MNLADESIIHVLQDEPIRVMDPFLFMTDDTEETMKRTGLRQVQILSDDSNTGLRGTNKRTSAIPVWFLPGDWSVIPQ